MLVAPAAFTLNALAERQAAAQLLALGLLSSTGRLDTRGASALTAPALLLASATITAQYRDIVLTAEGPFSRALTPTGPSTRALFGTHAVRALGATTADRALIATQAARTLTSTGPVG